MNDAGWTLETLKEHFDDLRAADQRALQIKEVGDGKALDLQKETQQYKDEKANELREQINSERNLYVTRAEFKPVLDYIAAEQGKSTGLNAAWVLVSGAIVVAVAIIGIVVKLK